MSSRNNHRKRSHRSEHMKAYAIGASARRAALRAAGRPKRRRSLLERIAHVLRQRKGASKGGDGQ